MVKKIKIKNQTSNYLINIGTGSFNKFIKDLNKIKIRKYILVDSIVYKKYKSYFSKIENQHTYLIIISCSEKIKSNKVYWNIISKLLINKINRSSIIVSVGGGTLGDLSGFIASTILRGVKIILIPTTLLSQVDSSIGGKNGINSKFGKNLIGTFYQPSSVIIDPLFLKTLPYREIKSGYAEIVKHALINDKKFFQWLKKFYKDVINLKPSKLTYAIEKSIKIKSKYVINDEKEVLKNSSSRSILNFGHTFGHALEALNNYKYSLNHGEAISIGMVLAAKISYFVGSLNKKHLEEIISHFNSCSLPIKSKLIKNNHFFKLLINDKKNENNKINLILLKSIGSAFYAKNFDIEKIKSLIAKI